MARNSLTKQVMDLLNSGDYDIVQTIDGEAEEPYEGCEHNLMMVLNSGEAKVTKLKPTDPHARENCTTYAVEYSTFFAGIITLYIWELC